MLWKLSVFCLLSSVFCPLANASEYNWTQTDWSGGEGQLFLEDSTEYYTKSPSVWDKVDGQLLLQGSKWEEFYNLTNAQKVYSLVQATDSTIYAGTGDNPGPIYKSKTDGTLWSTIFIHPTWLITNPLLKRSNGYFYTGLSHQSGVRYMIRNAGEESGPYADNPLSEATSINAIIESEGYLITGAGGASGYIYKQVDAGTVWTPIATISDNKILCIIKYRGDTLFAGTGNNNGIVVRSTNNGDSWVECTDLPGAKSVYCLCQGEDSTLYAGTDTSGIIYKTLNGGNTWVECGDLPLATKVRSLIYIPTHSALVAGCECEDDTARVFISIDNGENWIPFGAMHGTKIPYCLLYTYNGSLFAGTDYNGAIFKATGFDTSGWFISSVYNTGDTLGCTEFETISRNATLNSQIISAKVRTFPDSLAALNDSATPWDSCIPCTSGQNISQLPSVVHGHPWIQYRMELATSNPFVTPLIHDVTIKYTFWPVLIQATVYGDETWQDSVITNDQVKLIFSEPMDTTITINASNIDSILRLNNNHIWLDSLGAIKSAKWDTTAKILTITLGAYPTNSTIMPGDTIFTDSISIVDLDGNPCITSCVITGSFGPVIDSIVASDGLDSLEYIDHDDYVNFYFSKRTNKPKIDKNNINNVFRSANHTFLDGKGEIRGDSCVWDSLGFVLTCSLKVDSLRPTIKVGDIVYTDSITILDKFCRGVVLSPCVISGSFGSYGPIITSAVAYEGWPPDSGVGDGDYIWIEFTKLIDTVAWNNVDIDTILKPRKNGVYHTWHPESLKCFVQQIDLEDPQGFPFSLLYLSFRKVGVEENSELRVESSKLKSYPIPFLDGVWIEFQIKSHPDFIGTNLSTPNPQPPTPDPNPVAIGDTIYPNPSIIKDLEDNPAVRFAILQGGLKSETPKKAGKDKSFSTPLLTLNSQLSTSNVSLRIYNLAGQLMRTLLDKPLVPGQYKIFWNGKDGQDKEVKSGVYFYKLATSNHTFFKKLIKLK